MPRLPSPLRLNIRTLGNHPLVIGLIDQLNLQRRRFHLVDVNHDAQSAAHTWLYVNGIRMRAP